MHMKSQEGRTDMRIINYLLSEKTNVAGEIVGFMVFFGTVVAVGLMLFI